MIWHHPEATPSPPDSGAWHERVPSLTVRSPSGWVDRRRWSWAATWTVAAIGWPTTGLAVVEEIEVEDDCCPTLTVAGA